MLLFTAALLALQTAIPPIGQRTIPADRLNSGAGLIPNEDEDPLIAAAAAYPLGSPQNPVRVGGPEGEQAYLARLRCADGTTPAVGPRAGAGVGAFGSVVASYALTCSGAASGSLFMDMYHAEHVEDRAPPGFTIHPG